MLSVSKSRVSVNGWFHGPPIKRPQPYIEPPLSFVAPNCLSVSRNLIAAFHIYLFIDPIIYFIGRPVRDGESDVVSEWLY